MGLLLNILSNKKLDILVNKTREEIARITQLENNEADSKELWIQ